MKTILLIDDCEVYRETTAAILLDAGHDVWEASSAEEAFAILNKESFDLIVCDLHLPCLEGSKQEAYSYEVGVKTIKEIKSLLPKVSLVALSNTAPADLQRIKRFLSPVLAFTKPVSTNEVLELINDCLMDKGTLIIQ